MNCDLVKRIFMITGFVLLISGAILWIYSTKSSLYSLSYMLISVPIFQNRSDSLLSYYEGPSKSFSIPLKLLKYTASAFSQNVKLHLIHNFWGYSFNITIYDGKVIEKQFFEEHNINLGDSNPPKRDIINVYDLPDELKRMGEFRVYCPYNTLVTKDISKHCKRDYGAFMKIDEGSYQDVVVDDINKIEKKSLMITFDNLKALPYNFIDIPQMYIGVWSKNYFLNLFYTSFLMTIVGLIIVVIVLIIFFVNFMDSVN